MKKILQSLALLLVPLYGVVTLGAEAEPPANALEVISLPLHVHVVTSRITRVHASADIQSVDRMLERINEVWASAGIHWALQETATHALASEDRIIAAMNGNASITLEFLLEAILGPGTTADGWHVFLVHDLASLIGAPGIYLPQRQSLIVSELDPAGLNDPGRIAAHELGHSLTLSHVPCVSEGNLMAAGCASKNRTRLEPGQVTAARRQAQLGAPAAY